MNNDLAPWDQFFHSFHLFLCALALVAAVIPFFTAKGSEAHKFGGMIYVPLAMLAIIVATVAAWHENSVVLFCFNSFCAYLLLSGWRAVHENETPSLIDFAVPATLFFLALGVMAMALTQTNSTDNFRQTAALVFFAVNGFYLSGRDAAHLRRRVHRQANKTLYRIIGGGDAQATAWLNRHVTGMVGSVIANLSVLILTVLPPALHWLWPAVLVVTALCLAWKQHEKRAKMRKELASVHPKFYRKALY